MGVGFFIYTMALLVISGAAGSVCISAYFVSHRRLFILAAALFFFYLFDVALIFQSEFLSQNLTFDTANFYSVDNAAWRTIMGAGFLACMWLIVCDYVGETRPLVQVGPIIAFVLASIACLVFIPEGPWRQFWYYSMRQIFMMLLALYLLIRYARTKDPIERTRLIKHKRLLIVFIVLIATTFIEDVINILILDPSVFNSEFPLYLSERNFSENILLLVLAFVAMRAARNTLSLQFEKPPVREDEPIQKHVDDILPTYCKRYGLSARESEVLRLVLLGKDNQNIATEMTVALGTVKAHVHNILKKTGQSDRRALAQDFWKN